MGVGDIFRSFDGFSCDISFTLNKKDKFKSACGGLITLTIYILMIGYLIIIISQPLKATGGTIETVVNNPDDNNTDANNTNTNNITNTGGNAGNVTIGGINFVGTYNVRERAYPSYVSYNNSVIFKPQEHGFMMGATLASNVFNSTSVYIEFYYFVFDTESGPRYYYIPLAACTPDMFPSDLEDELTNGGVLDHMTCPDLQDIEIYGSSNTLAYAFFEVDAVLCLDTNDGCVDSETLQDALPDTLQIVWTESIYDHNNPSNPIKSVYNHGHTIGVVYGSNESSTLSMKMNKVLLTNGTEQTFTQTGFTNRMAFPTVGSVYPAVAMFELADTYDVYEQYIDYQPVAPDERRNLATDSIGEKDILSSEYFIFYTLAQLGGLHAFFALCFGFVMKSINSKTFIHDVINEIYRNDNMKKVETENFEMNNQPRNAARRVVPENEYSQNISQNRSGYGENAPLANEYQSYHGPPPARMPRQPEMYDGGDGMGEISRRRGMDQPEGKQYGTNDLVYSILCCGSENDSGRRTRAGRLSQFKKEAEIFNEERDIVTVITTIRTLKSKIKALEGRVDNAEMVAQNQPIDHEPPVKSKTKQKKEYKEKPKKMKHKKSHRKRSPRGPPEEEKTQSHSGSNINNETSKPSTQKKSSGRPADQMGRNNSISQIIDEINPKQKHKEEVRSINDIVDKVMTAIQEGRNHHIAQIHGKHNDENEFSPPPRDDYGPSMHPDVYHMDGQDNENEMDQHNDDRFAPNNDYYANMKQPPDSNNVWKFE